MREAVLALLIGAVLGLGANAAVSAAAASAPAQTHAAARSARPSRGASLHPPPAHSPLPLSPLPRTAAPPSRPTTLGHASLPSLAHSPTMPAQRAPKPPLTASLPSHTQAPRPSTASRRPGVAPALGGPASYDPKRAALLGAGLMPHKH
jgi:hypothetical protein